MYGMYGSVRNADICLSLAFVIYPELLPLILKIIFS